jgi:hypothetical protein
VDPKPKLIFGFSISIDAALEHAFVNAGNPSVDPVSDSGTGTIRDTKDIDGPTL